MSYPWYTHAEYLLSRYGERVYRIGVDAGFSCPNRNCDRSGGCIYCDGTGAVAVYQREEEKSGEKAEGAFLKRLCSIEEQIERGKKFIRYRYKAKLASLYFQSWSNTFAPVEKLKRIYDHALSLGSFSELVISTRPDLLSDEVCSLLASYKSPEREVWVEVGLQTSSDETLEKINRGHDRKCYIDAVKRLHQYGLKVCTHLLLMPCFDRRSTYLESIALINELGVEAVKIHNLHITHHTKMEEFFLKEGCIALSSIRRHVSDVALMLAHLHSSCIVERLMAETTKARLLCPKHFPDKRDILEMIAREMERNGWVQGCLE
ncbi:MAG: TIGR01212 family radical SAM protein [Sphaerochaetaceae bacterium]|nr:TIGR01212 family radical SAM protein [Sphaerochaetaceae bacterium]